MTSTAFLNDSLVSELQQHADVLRDQSLQGLFDTDPQRASSFSLEAAGLYLDYSKTHSTYDTFGLFEKMAQAADFENQRHRLVTGGIVNPTENRPALHTALRGTGPSPLMVDGDDISEMVKNQIDAMCTLAHSLREGALVAENGTPYKHVICLGIGGSSLGPDLLLDALSFEGTPAFDMHVVSNIDAHAFIPVFKTCDPAQTLLVVASKTFTTIETLVNAKTVMAWMAGGGVKKCPVADGRADSLS